MTRLSVTPIIRSPAAKLSTGCLARSHRPGPRNRCPQYSPASLSRAGGRNKVLGLNPRVEDLPDDRRHRPATLASAFHSRVWACTVEAKPNGDADPDDAMPSPGPAAA
jgi:hypothetical protein